MTVVSITGDIPEPVNPDVNQELVDYLEKLLGYAKSGTLKHGTFALTGDVMANSYTVYDNTHELDALFGLHERHRVGLLLDQREGGQND